MMKASELVELLQKKIARDGDLEVRIPSEPFSYIEDADDTSDFQIMGISTQMGSDDKPVSFMIMDEGWADALGGESDEED